MAEWKLQIQIFHFVILKLSYLMSRRKMITVFVYHNFLRLLYITVTWRRSNLMVMWLARKNFAE